MREELQGDMVRQLLHCVAMALGCSVQAALVEEGVAAGKVACRALHAGSKQSTVCWMKAGSKTVAMGTTPKVLQCSSRY